MIERAREDRKTDGGRSARANNRIRGGLWQDGIGSQENEKAAGRLANLLQRWVATSKQDKDETRLDATDPDGPKGRLSSSFVDRPLRRVRVDTKSQVGVVG